MLHCPVCGKEHPQEGLCDRCGFDLRCDYERHRTLVSALPEGAKPLFLRVEAYRGSNVSPQESPQTNPQTNPQAGAQAGALERLIDIPQASPRIGGRTEKSAPDGFGGFTKGLEFDLRPDKRSYSVTGIGSAKETMIAVPSVHQGKPVTGVGRGAFLGCKSLTSVVIPKGVRSIAGYAFASCKNLANVSLPQGIANIGEFAFGDCKNLTGVSLPQGILFIGDDAFNGCKSLIDMVIPQGVTSIGNRAFYDCKSLRSVILPEGMTVIGNSLLAHCKALESVVIPGSVTGVGKDAFLGCNELSIVFFGGSAADWRQISVGGGNSALNSATKCFYSEGLPTTPGYYWHWVGGLPSVW